MLPNFTEKLGQSWGNVEEETIEILTGTFSLISGICVISTKYHYSLTDAFEDFLAGNNLESNKASVNSWGSYEILFYMLCSLQ